jgi:hypothetical protein
MKKATKIKAIFLMEKVKAWTKGIWIWGMVLLLAITMGFVIFQKKLGPEAWDIYLGYFLGIGAFVIGLCFWIYLVIEAIENHLKDQVKDRLIADLFNELKRRGR